MVNIKSKNQRQHNHYPVSFISSVKITFWFFYELISNIPALYSMNRFYKTRKTNPSRPNVALIGDNLDEVNGIALSTRSFVRAMHRKNRPVFLIGVAFHNKPARMETAHGGNIIMLPARCSMEQVGYQGSESAIPNISLMLRLLKRYPIDLIELESPGGVGMLILLTARIIGIKTVTHYRTDLPAYFKKLIHNRLGRSALKTWVTCFTRYGGPVIVPSNAFKKKIIDMGVPAKNIFKLPRGVHATMFHPDKKNNGAWERFTSDLPGTRIIYMGRISREKNLSILVEALPRLLEMRNEINLTLVGEGPYRKEMESRLKPTGKVGFTGVLRGNDLAGVLAAADIMVFPSTTDTFGNTVIEALGCGVPCIVSDEGGPQEIIENHKSGLIFHADDVQDFIEKLLFLVDNPDKLEEFKVEARQRALKFTYENSIDKFWEFYCRMVSSNS
ncbi:glycosyltransferase [Fibrobacterota bacterium]